MTDAGDDNTRETIRPTRHGERGPHSRVNEGATEPIPWVGRATAQPPTDPWPTTEQPVYSVAPQPVPGQPMYMYAQPPPRRRFTALLVVAGVIAACCGGGATIALISSAAVRNAVGISSGNPGGAPAPITTQPAPTTPAPPPEPGLNTPVQDGKFEFVVTSVSCGHESVGRGPISARAKGQFCLVDLSVENVGTSGQLLLDGVQRGFDTDGKSYTPDSGAGVIANAGTSIWINMLDPGKKVTGTLVFDVPKREQISKLELHDSAFSRGATVTVA